MIIVAIVIDMCATYQVVLKGFPCNHTLASFQPWEMGAIVIPILQRRNGGSSETICLGPLSYEGVQLGFRAHLLNRCTTYPTPV